MHGENLLRNTVMKKRKQETLFWYKKCKRNLVFRVQYGALHLLFGRRQHVFVWTAANLTHTKIHASVVCSDILELNFPFWEKIYGRPYVMIYRLFRFQWLLEVPPSLTTKNSTSCQQSVFANSL
jgi:hypothetical protein